MDYFQQSKKQKEISEGLFDKILSKKQPLIQHADSNPNFYQKPDGTFMFGNKSTAKEVSTPSQIPFLKDFPWKSSKLNFLFLPGTEFQATYIDFDLKAQTISHFEGKWISGPFYGEHFEGIFQGTSFQGDFVGKYSDYKAKPVTFIDGTFQDTTNSGLLGIPNVVSLHKIRNRKFNFLSIPAGHSLQFRSANGIEGYIKVLKRLDHVNSTFEYEVLDGFKGERTPHIMSLPWSFFRQNFDSGIIYIHPKSPRNIAGIIQVPEGDSIIEMHISSAPVTFQTAKDAQDQLAPTVSGFQKNKIFKVALKALPEELKTLVKPQEIMVSFKTPEEYEEFQNIISYINSGILEFDISNIQRAVQFGEVDGYGTFTYLASIFNNIPGKNILNILGRPRTYIKRSIAENGTMPNAAFKEPERTNDTSSSLLKRPETAKQDILSSMKRMNDFVKYFVANIVDLTNKKDTPIQQEFMVALKTVFGTKPVVNTTSTGSAAKEVVKGLGLKKSKNIRSEIRNIIKDGF